jgi:hypothetical protein
MLPTGLSCNQKASDRPPAPMLLAMYDSNCSSLQLLNLVTHTEVQAEIWGGEPQARSQA